MQLPGWLNELDTQALLAINGAHDPVLDFIFYWAAYKFTWIPFYIWILYVIYRNYGKQTWKFLPVIAAMITMSDQLSTLLKNTTERFRPCHEPAIQHLVHLVNGECGGSFGFVSSHAANSTALAVFVMMLLPKGYIALRAEMIAFVLINIYSRIYLGAHYPLDILCGAFLGFVIGLVCSTFMRNFVTIPKQVAAAHE